MILSIAIILGCLSGTLVLTSLTSGAAFLQFLQITQYFSKVRFMNIQLGDLVETILQGFAEGFRALSFIGNPFSISSTTLGP